MKTHLVLISAQAVPNFTPILDERFKPDEVVMLVSEKMLVYSAALEKIYQPNAIKVSRWFISDPWDIEHIHERIEALLEKNYPSITLNATGGTKPMSIAAYEVFREKNLDIFYIHPELDRLIWMHPKRPSVDLADRIQLKEYLIAYGADKVNVSDRHDVDAKLCDLSSEIVKYIKRYAPVLPRLNYFAASANNAHLLSAEIDSKYNGDYSFWDLVDLFIEAGLLKREGTRLLFADKNARFLVNGGWLELYVYTCCLNIKESIGIQDLRRNVEVSRKQGKHYVLNELDIALLKDNCLYVIECKTRRYGKDNKGYQKGSDILYKLDSLTAVIGGLQAKAMLASIEHLQSHDLNRAQELGIQMCCYQDLAFLEERVAEWVLTRQ